MGLDGVELLLEIEDRFGISIPDQVATNILTVGELSDYVASIVASPSGRCLSQKVFHSLRSALTDVVGLERHAIKPISRLDDFLPAQQRRIAWDQLQHATGYNFPRLARPPWLQLLFVLLPASAACIGILFFPPYKGRVFLCGVAASAAIFPFTASMATHFPRDIQTVSDLVRSLMARKPRGESDTRWEWNREEVWHVVRQIVSEQFGINIEEINRKTRFIEDLNVG